jgi:hypothetical protein
VASRKGTAHHSDLELAARSTLTALLHATRNVRLGPGRGELGSGEDDDHPDVNDEQKP